MEQIIRENRQEGEILAKMSIMSKGLKLKAVECTAYREEGETSHSHIVTTVGGRRSIRRPIPQMRSKIDDFPQSSGLFKQENQYSG